MKILVFAEKSSFNKKYFCVIFFRGGAIFQTVCSLQNLGQPRTISISVILYPISRVRLVHGVDSSHEKTLNPLAHIMDTGMQSCDGQWDTRTQFDKIRSSIHCIQSKLYCTRTKM